MKFSRSLHLDSPGRTFMRVIMPWRALTSNGSLLYRALRDWSKSTGAGGGGWAGAFQNVVARQHMTYPFHLAQN